MQDLFYFFFFFLTTIKKCSIFYSQICMKSQRGHHLAISGTHLWLWAQKTHLLPIYKGQPIRQNLLAIADAAYCVHSSLPVGDAVHFLLHFINIEVFGGRRPLVLDWRWDLTRPACLFQSDLFLCCCCVNRCLLSRRARLLILYKS